MPSGKTLTVFIVLCIAHPALAAEPVTFEQHVRPILKTYCLNCHGAGEKMPGDLDLRLKRFAPPPQGTTRLERRRVPSSISASASVRSSFTSEMYRVKLLVYYQGKNPLSLPLVEQHRRSCDINQRGPCPSSDSFIFNNSASAWSLTILALSSNSDDVEPPLTRTSVPCSIAFAILTRAS